MTETTLQVRVSTPLLHLGFDQNEIQRRVNEWAETIVLARELSADWVLMDEKKGRRKLDQLNLKKIGTVGILLKAKQAGLLSVVEPEVRRLRQQGFSLSQTVVDAALQQAGE